MELKRLILQKKAHLAVGCNAALHIRERGGLGR